MWLITRHNSFTVPIELHRDPSNPVPVVETDWAYDPDVPYAIDVHFPDVEKPLSFDREIPTFGLSRYSGDYNVHFYPDKWGRFVHMDLRSQDTCSEYLVPLFPLVDFLGKTFKAVPCNNKESTRLAPAISRSIGRILRER